MNNSNEEASNKVVSSAAELSSQALEQRRAGHLEAAVALYERALALDEQRVEDWVERGQTLWMLERNEAALECYDRALTLDPRHARAWMHRGNALGALERHSEVLPCYDRALEINSLLPRAWYNKGQELGRQSRIIEAKACFENARDLGREQGDTDIAIKSDELVRYCEHVLMNEYYG